MVRTDIPVLPLGRVTTEPALTAITAADGGAFVPDLTTVLKVQNTDVVGNRTVTIPSIVSGISRSVDLTPAATAYLRVDGSAFTQPDGKAHVDVSGAGITAAVLTLPRVDLGY